MDHIIVNLQPFVYEQEIQVYKNGECIKIAKSSMNNLDENIAVNAKIHDNFNIDIVGSKLWGKQLKKRLQMNKFKMDLNITLY